MKRTLVLGLDRRWVASITAAVLSCATAGRAGGPGTRRRPAVPAGRGHREGGRQRLHGAGAGR